MDTIIIQTLKRMKIVKYHKQWVAHMNGFYTASDPSTLAFEEKAEDEPEAQLLPLTFLTLTHLTLQKAILHSPMSSTISFNGASTLSPHPSIAWVD